jgi:large subunit ribosomal protein L41
VPGRRAALRRAPAYRRAAAAAARRGPPPMAAWGAIAAAFGRARRVPKAGYKVLTSKLGPRTFYKGKGCAPTGRHTRKGGYIVEEARLPVYVLPEGLAASPLKPYVAHGAPPAAA